MTNVTFSILFHSVSNFLPGITCFPRHTRTLKFLVQERPGYLENSCRLSPWRVFLGVRGTNGPDVTFDIVGSQQRTKEERNRLEKGLLDEGYSRCGSLYGTGELQVSEQAHAVKTDYVGRVERK